MNRRTYPVLIAGLLLVFVTILTLSADTVWREQGVLHLEDSPYAKLRNVPIRAVTLGKGLWAQRRRVAVEKSIPTIWELLEANGYVDNFRRISEGKDVDKKGPVFADTDTYKWLEGVANFLQSGNYPELRATAGEAIAEVVAIQEPTGYLNAHFVGELAEKRLLPETLEHGHELYNLGHMLQAAVAYYRATGDLKLLEAGIKFADYLVENFGPNKKPLFSGHPEIEMALVELYRTTGRRRYLDLAGYLLQGDERLDREPHRVVYTFSGTPFTSRTELEGHAVRAMYACSGATDYYIETGDKEYWQTLERLWKDMVNRKMYVTGGLGARWSGESFGEPYELPNARSYAETCAAIGSMMWNWRMLAATGEARFTDVLERALYNAVNVGMSINGTLYCYRNPLEFSGEGEPNWQSEDGSIRNPWYYVLCCPPNIQRTLGALPGLFYSTSDDGLYVHLFHNSKLDWYLESGVGIQITQRTNYPWEGGVEMTVSPSEETEFTLYVRIPGWSERSRVSVNGKAVTADSIKPGEYLPLRRRWSPGDRVKLEFDMETKLLTANPRVRVNTGRVAVQRGPVVYALEGIDQPGVEDLFDVSLLVSGDPAGEFEAEYRPDLLGGVAVLRHTGVAYEESPEEGKLYRPLGSSFSRPTRPVELTLIPYYAWANRETSAMRVWIPYKLKPAREAAD